MIVKVRASFIFGITYYENSFDDSILGIPVLDDERELIGTIVGYNKDKDLLELDIDDTYKTKLIHDGSYSAEVVYDR